MSHSTTCASQRFSPPDIYCAILEGMPIKSDYRHMSGRTKSTRTNDGGTRTKLDLFPQFIRHLPLEKKGIWEIVGKALVSKVVREAFRQRLAPGLQQRFGPDRARRVGNLVLNESRHMMR